MAAVIKATAITTDPAITSSIAMAATAAQECIRTAGISVDEIDLLINVGVYRDNNMVEPAMAALVQKEIGHSRDYIKYPTAKAALGLDLMNGGCGVLNAIQVASSFLATGKAQYVLIVSSDAHPSNQNAPGFPYVPMGAAMILERGARAEQGFGRLSLREQPGGSIGSQGYASVADGRHQVTVTQDPDFADRLLVLATQMVTDHVAREGLDLARTLLVTSQITPDFGARLAAQLNLGADAVATGSAVAGDAHSSALTLTYHGAAAQMATGRYDQILFVGAAAGPIAACAVYRP